MLQAIRERAHGIFAWVLLILIGVPFALWGIQNYMDGGQETPVAVVDGHKIYERDVNRAYEQNMQALPDLAQLDEKEVKRQSLDRLIRDELISGAAEALSLRVGDDVVRDFIQTLPYFQTDGKFDKEKYKQMLSAQNLDPGLYTEQLRKALSMEQYQQGITESALVLEQQLQEIVRLRNQQRTIEYFTVPLRKVEQTVSDPEIAAYYEQHKSDFREPEMVSVDYLILTLEQLASEVKPSEADLRAFYEEQKSVFTTEERRRVSHILVAAEPGKPEAEKIALEKVQALRDRLLKGEAFAKVAKEASDDPISAAKGGDLGNLTNGAMDPSIEKAAKGLAKDQVSEPVKTSFGYHLVTVTDLQPTVVKGFEQVKPELVKLFQRNAADNRFYELGQKLTELSFEHPDTLEPSAKATGLQIQSLPPFSRESGSGVAERPAFRDAAFGEDVLNGKNSDLIELSPEEVAVLRVREHRAAAEKPLTAVKQQVLERIREDRSRAETRKLAEEALKALHGGATLGTQAKSLGVAVTAPTALKRDSTDVPPKLIEEVFSTRKPADGKPVSGIAALDDGKQVVFQLKAVAEGKAGAGDEEITRLREYLARSSGQRQFAAWVEDLRLRSDVEILQKDR